MGWERMPLQLAISLYYTMSHTRIFRYVKKKIYELTHKVHIKQIFMKNLMQAIEGSMEILTSEWKTVDFKFLDTWQYGFVKLQQ
jgi:hypothetical protein